MDDLECSRCHRHFDSDNLAWHDDDQKEYLCFDCEGSIIDEWLAMNYRFEIKFHLN